MIILKDTINFLENILKTNDCLVIGVSGGPDSMCLLDLVNKQKELLHLKIIVAHINHGVRKESEEEACFVKRICKEKNIIFEYQKLQFEEKKNFEFQARKKRYQFFNEIVKKYKAKFLLTAHHGDDLIETVLMRITRGSNLHGYSGFQNSTKTKNYTLLRPLIYTTKQEIEKYNVENQIEYRIDSSNQSQMFTRNRFRTHILPFLKKENKNVHRKFLKMSENLNEIDMYLEKQVQIALTTVSDFDKVNLREFKELDSLMQRCVLEYILKKEYQDKIYLINDKHVKLIQKISNSSSSNAKINLPLKKTWIKEYNTAYFKKKAKEENKEYILEESLLWNTQEKIERIKKSDTKSNYILRLDSKEIAFPLKVRTRKPKDTIKVKNLKGTKKVKDIFINEKIGLEKRNTWPIVVDKNDTILWIPGVKKSNFDKNIEEYYDIIYKYVISKEKENEEK